MKQKQIAALVGVSGKTIVGYETGQKRIPAARLEALAEALEKPVTWFRDGEQE